MDNHKYNITLMIIVSGVDLIAIEEHRISFMSQTSKKDDCSLECNNTAFYRKQQKHY